jgi:formate dehydrogenase subunit gamma
MTTNMTRKLSVRKALALAGLAALFAIALTGIVTLTTTAVPPAQAQGYRVPPPPDVAAAQAGRFAIAPAPGQADRSNIGTPQNAAPGSLPRADLWRNIRQGIAGRTSIGGPQAGVLVQSDGENFRIVQNGPLPEWGGWLMLAMIVLLALFFAIRGRIRIEGGESGHTIQRFNLLERFMHWLTAISFVLLALTGLNVLYGRYVLKPIMGAYPFAHLTAWGKHAHYYVAFAFMAGLALMFVLWVAYNLPTMADLKWLLQGGGLFSKKGSHAPAYKFNAGQKLLFWFLILGGFSVSFSGLCLLMPLTLQPFAPTFAVLNVFGLGLPTSLTVLQETQLALFWHAAVALLMITLILAHVYIGTLGMEGALRAMTDGKVDENWALEHHPLWVEQLKQQEMAAAVPQPAE